MKQGFKKTISWVKYRSDITTQLKKNNLDCMIDPSFRKINRFFVQLFSANANNNDYFP